MEYLIETIEESKIFKPFEEFEKYEEIKQVGQGAFGTVILYKHKLEFVMNRPISHYFYRNNTRSSVYLSTAAEFPKKFLKR